MSKFYPLDKVIHSSYNRSQVLESPGIGKKVKKELFSAFFDVTDGPKIQRRFFAKIIIFKFCLVQVLNKLVQNVPGKLHEIHILLPISSPNMPYDVLLNSPKLYL